MKFLLLFLLSFSAFAITITNDSIIDADQLRVLNSASITLNNNMDANSKNITGVANLTATGTTTLNTGLTGFLKAASGVVSSTTALSTTVTKTTATLAVTGEENILCDSSSGNVTLTLPAVSGNNGLTYRIHNLSDSNTCTIDGNASETINGVLSLDLESAKDSLTITTDGTSWYSLSQNIDYIAEAGGNDSNTITANTEDILFDTASNDTHGSWTNAGNTGGSAPGAGATDAFTAEVAGCFSVTGSMRTSSATTAEMAVYVDGSKAKVVGYFATRSNDIFNGTICLAVNEVLTMRTDIGFVLAGGAGDHWIKIIRISHD